MSLRPRVPRRMPVVALLVACTLTATATTAQLSASAATPDGVGGATSSASASTPPGTSAPEFATALKKLRAESDGAVAVHLDPATGRPRLLTVEPGGDLMPEASPGRAGAQRGALSLARSAPSTDGNAAAPGEGSTTGALPSAGPTPAPAAAAQAIAASQAWFDANPAVMGMDAGQLGSAQVETGAVGTTVTWTQQYLGVPVFGAAIKVNLDSVGHLTAVSGYAAPDLNLATQPATTPDAAAAQAVELVRTDPPTQVPDPPADSGAAGDAVETGTAQLMQQKPLEKPLDVGSLQAEAPSLVIYRVGEIRGVPGENVLAWSVKVTNGADLAEQLLLDANNLKPLNRYSLVHDALNRTLQVANGTTTPPLVWREGDPLLPTSQTLTTGQDAVLKGAADTYWFFRNSFGRDSYNGAGSTMASLMLGNGSGCPNAYWNGIQAAFCDGITSDDVVAHEWGHAITGSSAELVYQYQPGALNEAYSDIWGETIDLINGRQDEGEVNPTLKRPDGECTTRSPTEPVVRINSPADLARNCVATGASFGTPLPTTGVTAQLIIPVDSDEDGAGTAYTNADGCSPYDRNVSGLVVLVDKGGCTYLDKAQRATAAGAAALLIANPSGSPLPMTGTGSTVPTTMIGFADRLALRNAFAAGRPVSLTVRPSSQRWLMGERSDGFGGAIRDMWRPTCYGHPGRVTDAEYYCGTGDSGGVHFNSGVPNHGYALLVDGGSYNGVTVPAIGLDKAAAIYYRALTAYLTPTSDFVDHADSLQAACTDLIGAPIKQLTTAPNATPAAAAPVSPSDCAAVAAMIQAVELRADPISHCQGATMLSPGDAQISCGSGTTSARLFSDDFEAGLSRWSTDRVLYSSTGRSAPWRITTTAPRRSGSVAWSPNLLERCRNDGNSPEPGGISSSDSITSPSITLPPDTMAGWLSFDHYVATENLYDGGNVKISINGGPFTVVPASAYVLNPPRITLAAGVVNGNISNTNPLAGQLAFSGTDPLSYAGTWGTSQLSLTAVGARAGDTISLRYEMGRDFCSGVDGWYVDNVRVDVCVPGTSPAAPQGGTPAPAPPAAPAPTPNGSTPNTPGSPVRNSPNSPSRPTQQSPPGTTMKTTTQLALSPRAPKPRSPFTAVVTVRQSNGAAASGRVLVRINGTLVGSAQLTAGKATIRVKQAPKSGRWQVTAAYIGGGAALPSNAVTLLRIK